MARSKHQSPEQGGATPTSIPGDDPVVAPGPVAGRTPEPGTAGDPVVGSDRSESRHQEQQLEVPRTRTSAAYSGIAVGLLVLVLVIVFITQNLNDASVHFITLHFRLPIGLLVLAAAVAGGILVMLVSAARVAQLRLMARRHRAGKPTG